MQKRKGFTLVELVIVIAVIAILAGVLIGTFASVINRANESAKLQEIKAQEVSQKAEDIIKKIENSNWFSWEDFENSLAKKLTDVYKSTSHSTDDIKSAVNESLTTYFANNKVENTSLTEDQVKAIVENALTKATLGGVTEEQVKTIVDTAVGGLENLSESEVQQIVDAATAKGLTAADVARIVTEQNLATSAQVQSVLNALNSAAKSSEVAELKAYIDSLKEEMVSLQAANANTINAKAFNVVISKSTTELKSILDVYDLFEGSEYDIQNYSSNVAGQTMYYDKTNNVVVCVDDQTDLIVSPVEYVGKDGDKTWYSLNMEIPKVEPTTYANADTNATATATRYNASSVTSTSSVTVKKFTATVTNGNEYVYIVNAYNDYVYNRTNTNVDLEITLANDIDCRGARAVITSTKGNITIDGQGHTLKNITNDSAVTLSDSNTEHNFASYGCAALICNGGDINNANCVSGKIEIKNITFENLNAKDITAGSVGILIGQGGYAGVTLDNVTVKNCSVIGHRNVAALVGAAYCNITLKNNIKVLDSYVGYIGGRSVLLVCINKTSGKLKCDSTMVLDITGSKLEMFNSPVSEQQIVSTDDNGKKIIRSVKTFNADGTPKDIKDYPQHPGLGLFLTAQDGEAAPIYTIEAGHEYQYVEP